MTGSEVFLKDVYMDNCVSQWYDLLSLRYRLKLCHNFKTINIEAEELLQKVYIFYMIEIPCHRDSP